MKRNFLSVIFAVLLASVLAVSPVLADSTDAGLFRAPNIYKGTTATKVYWTAGTINNGGDSLAVTAGSHDLTANQNDCAAPTFTACNFVFADNAGTVDVTTTLATAIASGNTLLAMIETGAADAIFTNVVLPQQSGTLWLQAAGPNMAAVAAAITPSAAGGTTVGSLLLPFSSVYVGDAATNNFQITGVATGTRVMTLPDVASDTFGLVGAAQTFTNKTLTSPVLNAATVGTSITPAAAAGSTLGTALLPWGNTYIGTAATNNFVLTPAATGAARVITLADPGGAATLAYTNSTSSQAMSGLGHLTPHTAATSNLGSATLPWGTAYIGTAATNNFVITPAATAAARVITLADPGGAATIAYSNPTTAQTITNTTLTTPTLTTPIYSGETARCSSQFNATNGDTGTTLTAVTGMSVTVVPGTYRFYVNVPGVSTVNSGIKLAFKYTTTVVSDMEATARGFSAAAVEVSHTTSAADEAVLFGDNTLAYISVVVEGVMVVGTGGTIQLEAAQNAAHADTTSVYEQASMTFTRLD